MAYPARDETPIPAAFLTAIFHLMFLAVFVALLFPNWASLPNTVWITIFMLSIVVSAATYYITETKYGGMLLYSIATPLALLLIISSFGSQLGYSPSLPEAGQLLLLVLCSGALASWFGVTLTGKPRIGGGMLESLVDARKKRRILKEED
jgi:hypothetical protein